MSLVSIVLLRLPVTKYCSTILLLIAACASESAPPVNDDAGVDLDAAAQVEPHDSGVDAGSAVSPVTVRLHYDRPIGVIFHDPSGAVISSTVATSEVSDTVPPDSMITLVDRGSTPSLHTITGVLPGETYDHFDSTAIVGRIELTVLTAFPNATRYSVDFGCFDYSIEPMVPVVLDVRRGCVGSARHITVSVLAFESDNDELAYIHEESVYLDPTNTTYLSLEDWRTELDPLTVSYVGATDEDASVRLLCSVVSGLVPTHLVWVPYPERPLPAEGTRSVRVPRFGEGFEISLWTERLHFSNIYVYQTDRTRRTFDLATDLLPLPILGDTDSTDPVRPIFKWVSAPDADASILTLDGSRPNIAWKILLDPKDGGIRLPELPEEYADLRPSIDTRFYHNVTDYELNTVADYDAYRSRFASHPFSLYEDRASFIKTNTVWREAHRYDY